MTLALRIDIDNPFGYSSRFRRQLNRLSINYNLIPRLSQLGYLDNAKNLSIWLSKHDIPATWFFRTATYPTKSLMPYFTRGGNKINLHAERTNSLEYFTKEVKHWEHLCMIKATGFSKHGSGVLKLSRMHHASYDPIRLMQYGKSMGFEYFVGNGMDYNEPFVKEDGFIYIPAVFWLDRIEQYGSSEVLKQLVEDSVETPVIVLMHPVWWILRPELRKNLDWLVENAEFTTIESIL
ncbi:MAG: hypothetical protein ACTSWA_09980 [Candidatus Thorarchaeota archaeon]